jgi:cytochrome c556
MRFSTPRRLLACSALAAALVSPLALSHFDDKQVNQSYRQSWFTLLAMNFGPMGSMAKGEMPWDDEALKGYARELEAVANLNLMRGFAEGSEQGTTRAKPEIWQNKADFESKLEDLRKASAALNAMAGNGDRKAIAEQIGAVGKTCKSCHDEYKSKNYLY